MQKESDRIAKFIANAGICSRREAEKLIEAGRVQIDGKIIKTPAIKVTQDNIVKVDGQLVAKQTQSRLWLFHKPKGTITSNKDPQGRKTVFEILPPELPRVISIGRLDYNTEGLLLLTNNGDLARHIELPSTGWIRKYKVRAHGRVQGKKLEELRQGVTIDGVQYAPAAIEIEQTKKDNVWLLVSITEGKNREVRKMLEHAGLEVNRLIRLSYGPFQLGNLPVGKVKPVPAKVIKEQVGF